MANNKELRKKYDNDFKTIQMLVNNFDPVGLIEAGAPDDEYDSITNCLLSGIYNKQPNQELSRSIKEIITSNFGESITAGEGLTFNISLDDLIAEACKLVKRQRI